MRRIQLFEFGDQNWFSDELRHYGFDLLATIFRLTKAYEPTAQVLAELMNETSHQRILVLAAGSGGGIIDIAPRLPRSASIVLTDIFPDTSFRSHDARLSYERMSVDATNVPLHLTGLRVMYTAFHHFRPEAARGILADAVKTGEPVAIFEITERSLMGVATILVAPFIILLAAPFVRPLNWQRLAMTYLFPLASLVALWDGFVSMMRTYEADDLKPILAEFETYVWKFEKLKGPLGIKISALTGRPAQKPILRSNLSVRRIRTSPS